jgi:hypothetical protein
MKVPSAAATTGVEVSMAAAISVIPHGALALGVWASDCSGVPATPRTGAITAYPYACTENVKAMTEAAKTLENILMKVKRVKGKEEHRRLRRIYRSNRPYIPSRLSYFVERSDSRVLSWTSGYDPHLGHTQDLPADLPSSNTNRRLCIQSLWSRPWVPPSSFFIHALLHLKNVKIPSKLKVTALYESLHVLNGMHALPVTNHVSWVCYLWDKKRGEKKLDDRRY